VTCIQTQKFWKGFRPKRPFKPGLWSRSPSDVEWLEPEPEIWAPVQQSLWSKPSVQIIQWFLVFNGPNRSGAGAKDLDARSQSPKFDFRLHWLKLLTLSEEWRVTLVLPCNPPLIITRFPPISQSE